ncbi:MAG: CdaR family transcriptional regulator [Chloroflexaceae bacterium]|nr:CdaR family transcriptional regulator [Chloroflexaceae bacterium]
MAKITAVEDRELHSPTHFPSPKVPTVRFTKTARTIASKVSELLRAPVLVSDANGLVAASSNPTQVGLATERLPQDARDFLQVPLQCDRQLGQVMVGQPGERETISPRLAKVLVELVINQTTLLSRLPNRQALKEQLIADLLQARIGDEAEVYEQAKLLGINLTPPRAAILIDAADYILPAPAESSGDAALAQSRRLQLAIGSVVSFFHLPDDTICAPLREGKIVVLKASNTKNLGEWAASEKNIEPAISSWANLAALKRACDELLVRLRSDTGAAVSIGVGRYHPGLQGLARSYQDAQVALSLGRRFQGHNQVYCLDSLGIAAFVGVADEQTKIELATHLLSPLDCELDLLATVTAFFENNCCPSATAKQLLIHRNTLSYRLDKVTSLIGLNPRYFDDAIQIRLSLLLRSLQQS